MPYRRLLLCLALLAGAGAARAQQFEPLIAPAREARRWATESLSEQGTSFAPRSAWAALSSGSLDDLTALGADYTQIFPSTNGRIAAVVTWSRAVTSSNGADLSARLSVRDADGRELRSFAVEPLQAFDISDDGRSVVAHGETMARVMECGAWNTHLVFYDGEGRELARVERGDFSPGISTTMLASAGLLVIGTTGRVVAYDLATGREAWVLPLDSTGDRPTVFATPDGRGVAVLAAAPPGPTRILRLDESGVARANLRLDGRVNAGSGVAFAQDLLVVEQIEKNEVTYHLLDPRTLRTLRSVRAN
ncbi:MAG: hypothetical protein U0527_16945 [Candidatus Eisenbacteria bacterium]